MQDICSSTFESEMLGPNKEVSLSEIQNSLKFKRRTLHKMIRVDTGKFPMHLLAVGNELYESRVGISSSTAQVL